MNPEKVLNYGMLIVGMAFSLVLVMLWFPEASEAAKSGAGAFINLAFLIGGYYWGASTHSAPPFVGASKPGDSVGSAQ